MKPKSVSGVTCFVRNLGKTIKFYETLGFTFRKREANHATAYLNWFWIDFLSVQNETRPAFRKAMKPGSKGAGIFLYLNVENVDEFHKRLISKRLKPSTKPQDSPLGNREFVIKDPDGHNLVFFKRI